MKPTGSVLGSVDMLSRSHSVSLLLQASSSGEVEEHVLLTKQPHEHEDLVESMVSTHHGLRQHVLSTVIQQDAPMLGHQGKAAVSILHEVPQVGLLDSVGMLLQSLPLRCLVNC